MQIFANMVNFTIKHEFLWFNLKTLKGNGILLLSHEDYANYTCQTLGFYDISTSNIWEKVFKNGTSEVCGSKQTHHFKFFKGCLPQILLGLILNTLSHMFLGTLTWHDKAQVLLCIY